MTLTPLYKKSDFLDGLRSSCSLSAAVSKSRTSINISIQSWFQTFGPHCKPYSGMQLCEQIMDFKISEDLDFSLICLLTAAQGPNAF